MPTRSAAVVDPRLVAAVVRRFLDARNVDEERR
jgi:hypothetical protein